MIFVILLTLFCTVYCNNDIPTEESFKVFFNTNTTRNRFVSLLKYVAKLNEERLGVLQKWYRLQENVPTDVLRSERFWKRYETTLKPSIIFIIIVSNPKISPNNGILPLYSNEHASKQTDEIPNNYRRKWQKSCSKKATKVCRTSCNNAFKKLCRRFKCTSRAKRAIKKECKFSCEKDFSIGKYSDDDSSDYSSDYSDSDC